MRFQASVPTGKPKSQSKKPKTAEAFSPGKLFTNLWPLQILILLLATLAVYSHTLDVPFYLDDYLRIHDNPVIYESHGAAALWDYGPMRVVGYLSFAMNYQLGRFDPAGRVVEPRVCRGDGVRIRCEPVTARARGRAVGRLHRRTGT